MEEGNKSRKHGPRSSKKQSTSTVAKKLVSKAITAKKQGSATFLLRDGSTRTQMIKSQCISVDKKGNRTRLRYIEGMEEIIHAKQGNVEGRHASFIVMRKGKLITDDKTKIKYIKAHPSFGKLFYEYDPVKVAKDELALDEAIEDAIMYARKGLNDQEAYELAKLYKLNNIDSLHISQIRIFLKACAIANPEEFNERRVGSEAKINNILSKAFAAGAIEIKDTVLVYKGGGTIVDRLPNITQDGKVDFIIRWIMTSEAGSSFLEDITD